MKLSDIPILIHTAQRDVGPPFAAITASAHLERLSTRFKVGIFDLFSRDACVRSDTDVGRDGLYPNGVLSGGDQDCVLACHVLPDQTPSSVSLWTLCWCAVMLEEGGAILKLSQQSWEIV